MCDSSEVADQAVHRFIEVTKNTMPEVRNLGLTSQITSLLVLEYVADGISHPDILEEYEYGLKLIIFASCYS